MGTITIARMTVGLSGAPGDVRSDARQIAWRAELCHWPVELFLWPAELFDWRASRSILVARGRRLAGKFPSLAARAIPLAGDNFLLADEMGDTHGQEDSPRAQSSFLWTREGCSGL